ncbi:hypothetical protein HDV03_003415 [Kappamyces sp. JEL0829]|nr:hypothetical protein HDV03_003415 [Kappamyces sp. JEL0829]
MKAVTIVEAGKAQLSDVPKPHFEADELLVQVHAASQNPTDWKHVKYISPVGSVMGCDFAGRVVAVGSRTEGYKVGDRVAGLVHGGDSAKQGSYAEYTPVSPAQVFRIPDSMSFEEASTFGVSSGTAAIALFQHLALQKPENPYQDSSRPKLLIWGSSSVAGLFAVQLAKLSNIRVVATASPHSHDLLRSLGAEAVFDYRDADVVQKIRAWADNELVYGLDCISEDSTVPLASQSMTGGQLVLLLSSSVANPANNPAVTLKPMLLYTTMGKAFTKMGNTVPAIPEDARWGAWWWKECTRLCAEGKLRPPRITVVGGLESFSTGFDRLEKGQVKAGKLVLKTFPGTPIIVHHLNNSRSQRILWLLEEIGLNYEIKHYQRDPVTQKAPKELEAIHPLGKSPVITDGDVVVAETGAIIEYLIEEYAPHFKPVSRPDRLAYTYWNHFAEGTAMTYMLVSLFTQRFPGEQRDQLLKSTIMPNLAKTFGYIEDHLSSQPYFAGSELSGADFAMVFPIEAFTARFGDRFVIPATKAWLSKISSMPSYKTALEKGGPYIYASKD